MCLTKNVYCWHCQENFTKQSTEDFEDCPHCSLGFYDLNPKQQQAVLMTLKPLEKPRCVVCNSYCSTLEKGIRANRQDDWEYCCLDLPENYVTRPIKEWLCQFCAIRQLEFFV